MLFRENRKFLSSLLLLPIAALFLSCCCLKAEASAAKKSSCSSCPKKETSDHQNDCPHAKIKAIADNHAADFSITKNLTPVIVLSLKESVLFFHPTSFIVPQLTAPPLHPSLYFQNPILRV